MINQMKGIKGITLVALIITIIVLLILAGVTISLVLGENGIIGQAKIAGEESRGASVEEQVSIWKTDIEMTKYTGGTSETLPEILQRLKKENLLKDSEIDEIMKKTNENREIEIGSKKISFKVDGNIQNKKVYLIPNMTSQTQPSGEISASNVEPTSNTINAFDGDTKTVWVGSGKVNQWIQYDFGYPVVCSGYKLGQVAEDLQVEYRLEGSIDGINYDTIVGSIIIPGGKDGNPSQIEQSFPEVEYQFWRLYYLSGIQTNACIGEINLLGYKTERSILNNWTITIPTLNSNIQAVTASNEISPAYQAFDQNHSSAWIGSGKHNWIQYDFGQKVTIKEIKLTQPSNYDWVVANVVASNDGINFTTILQDINIPGRQNSIKAIISPASYQYWRLEITNCSQPNASIGSFELFGN